MNTGIKTYTVTIFNERYTLATDQSEKRIKDTVAMIDGAMHTISKQFCIADGKKVAVLVALKIAEDLLVMQSDQEQMHNTIENLSLQVEQIIKYL